MEKKFRDAIPLDDIYLFNTGNAQKAWLAFGCHFMPELNCHRFLLWAPNARSVSVVGDFNDWNDSACYMERVEGGVWAAFVEGVYHSQRYKYCVEGPDGSRVLKTDPFAQWCQYGKDTAAMVYNGSDYQWKDADFMARRAGRNFLESPMSIYEVHLGSWKDFGWGLPNYRQLGEELARYCTEMAYTHVEIMPVTEFPFDGSWGYQITGYYSANSRFGHPTDLKYFIDKCHKAGLYVVMDWVPAHFPRDSHGLARFDGSCLYEHPDSRRGEHREWGTLVFDWTKTEIHSFLISNAIFWLEEYHFDGLRVDAVSSMLYLDYNRQNDWLPNKYGGKENLEAIEFLQTLNRAVFERFPNALMIAEESTAWGGVTKPVHEGGLGFNFKWNMGWMNDILRYMAMDPYFRGSNHNLLTFSMMYAYSENYILPLSHDEVVHGKKSLIDKMYGDYEQKFKSLRLLYSFMYAHPGKKLLFMGGEFAQFIEWRFAEGLEWQLLGYDRHKQMLDFTKDLSKFYQTHKAFHENDNDWDGFTWINAEDSQNSTISFMRKSRSGRDKVIAVLNFAAADHESYRIGVPTLGDYEIIFTTDAEKYGGEGRLTGSIKAKKGKTGDFDYYIEADLPGLSSMYLKKVAKKRKVN